MSPWHAVITMAGDLPASAVIHTVGPVWHGGDRMERKPGRCLQKQPAAGGGKQLSLHCVSGDQHRRVWLSERGSGGDRRAHRDRVSHPL